MRILGSMWTVVQSRTDISSGHRDTEYLTTLTNNFGADAARRWDAWKLRRVAQDRLVRQGFITIFVVA